MIKLEKGEIPSTHLMFLVIGFLQGSLLTGTFAKEYAKHDIWIVLTIAFLLNLPLAYAYLTLALKFPGNNLIQINDIIFGPYLGKVVSIQYILMFFMIIAANFWFVGDFILTFFVPETPSLVIIIMFAFVCAWAVRAGVEVFARMSFILVIMISLTILITFMLLLKDMKFSYFLPIFDLPLPDFIHGTHILMAIPFNEVFVFLMVIPCVNKLKEVKSSILYSLILGWITFLIVVVRNAAVLGPLGDIVTSPSMEAVRLIDIGHILNRLEAIVAISFILTMFLKVAVFYYATVLGIAQVFKLRSYVPLVIPIGILGILIAQTYESTFQYNYTAINTYPIFSLPFYVVIPVMSLLIAKLRKLPKQKERNAQ